MGDVKIGKQGEVVYQRKYGEQIRRGLSPKRAIPSQAQINQRQLYRDALTWRQTLTLPNRRYLEGYCYANWVVDSYKIPLPWHRFALKLSLEHIKFIPSLTTKELVGEEAVDQEYTTGDATSYVLNQAIWIAQTFTPAITGKLTKLKVKLYRPYDYDEFTIKIVTTNENGYPTNNVLCSTIFDSEPITEEEPGLWYPYIPDVLPTLTKEVVYAIIIHGTLPFPNPDLYWRRDSTAPQYFRGCIYRSDTSGTTWTRYLYDDCMFQTFMLMPGETITYGTLHVRHPAIKSFTQKRNGLIVRAEDNLSSLDDEYLTGQVGLDVEKGDTIEATTVAGVSYRHRV
ncbi:hypothetical protein ES705_43022 [subsurface metagenome]